MRERIREMTFVSLYNGVEERCLRGIRMPYVRVTFHLLILRRIHGPLGNKFAPSPDAGSAIKCKILEFFFCFYLFTIPFYDFIKLFIAHCRHQADASPISCLVIQS